MTRLRRKERKGKAMRKSYERFLRGLMRLGKRAERELALRRELTPDDWRLVDEACLVARERGERSRLAFAGKLRLVGREVFEESVKAMREAIGRSGTGLPRRPGQMRPSQGASA
jgi:hypothetical protein